jgi:formate-dependent nitrite reductase membrane component NrfD
MSGRPELGTTRLPREHGTSPYGRPVIKPPVWTPEIPLYFYTGGLAGASAGVGALCEWRGECVLARRAWGLAFAGSVVSPALLISDLGVPKRFLHMLRMFKVTSPMSVGSWVLAAFGTATAPATAHSLIGLGRPGQAAQLASALLGLPLSAYTAALIANTAVPVWHEARIELPFLFTAGAAMSAGAALTVLTPIPDAEPARRLAVGGAVAELAVVQLMEHRLSARGVGDAYHQGNVKRLNHAAKLLTATGAAIIAARGSRSRRAAVIGGTLLTGGAVAERWTVFRAGSASAARPQDTIDPQRARIDRGDTRGAARSASRRPPPGEPERGHHPGERPVPLGSPAIDAGPGATAS